MTDSPSPSSTTPAGPGAWLIRLCAKFDRLFSFDHSDARQAKTDYDEAFHDAVHALKDLRQFAKSISPTWTGVAPATSLPAKEETPPEITELIAGIRCWIPEYDWPGVEGIFARLEGFFREQQKEIEREEGAASQLLDERDAAEEALEEIDHAQEMLRAELASLKEEQREDKELLDWCDTLPNGIGILADARFPQARYMTPKARGFSHTRQLIREARKERGGK